MKDTLPYVAWANGKFLPENTYTYQLLAPKGTHVNELRRMMKEDLKRYFGLEATLKPTKLGVWVLKAKHPDRLKTKGGNKKMEPNALTGIRITNEPAAWLIRCIRDHLPLLTIVDESNLKGYIDIDLKANVADPASIHAGLQEYGMSLTFEEKIVDVLVLSLPAEHQRYLQ